MIDSHCHLDVAAFDADRDDTIARALAAGVTAMIIPAIRPAMWPGLRALARRHAEIRYAIGVHPQVIPEEEPMHADALARSADGAIAIGETGLDGATDDMEAQVASFRTHIRAARARGLPLIVHALRSHDLVPKILREEKAHEVGGVLHSYSGGANLVPVYRDLGFAFGIAGPITYPNARRPIEAARAIPEDLLLVETDSPDQAPEGHRGGRNEPAHLLAVVTGLASALGRSISDVASLTSANACRIFRAFP